LASIRSCKCGRFKVDADVYPKAAAHGILDCPDCKTSPYEKKVDPNQKDLVEPGEVPEGMVRTFTVKMGDIMVGTAAELQGHVVLHILPAEVAIAIPLDVAYQLHEGMCTAINFIDNGASLEIGEDDLPKEKKDWN